MDDSLLDPEFRKDAKFPHIKSFIKQRNALTKAQAQAYEQLYPKFAIDYRDLYLDYTKIFPQDGKVILEIGSGMGETTVHIAQHRTTDLFIALEVFKTGVAALLKQIEEQQLTNLRVIQHDAVEVLRDMIAPESLDGVHIYFPDPWHKKRHHKRRLIQPPFVRLLCSRLKPGAYIHCATDWEPYAEQILEVLNMEPSLQNTTDGFAPKPDYRPLTKFEQRGLNLGYRVHDLLFRKRKD